MTQALKAAIEALIGPDGSECRPVRTPVDGLVVMRSEVPTPLQRMIYHPVLCLVLQGVKQVMAGEQVFEFGEGQSLIVSFDLPVLGRVTRASRDAPYLALALDLDLGMMGEIIDQLEPLPAPVGDASTIFIHEADEALIGSVTRLMDLLRQPQAIPILRPSIVREIHYWLLAGRHGPAIRSLIRPDSHVQRIARAIAVLRGGFDQAIRVERLAQVAGMSVSSFHHHFKATTSMTPLQYQKQLRLLEARRLMFADSLTAARAAYQVGYESVSQFSREYARMFGAPPRRDLVRSIAA
jgi:AraC-like DNA-binding protein